MKQKLLLMLSIFSVLSLSIQAKPSALDDYDAFLVKKTELSSTITLTVTPGTLNTLIGTDKTTVTYLEILGSLNAQDIATVKQMTSLIKLDLSKASFVESVSFSGGKGHIILPNNMTEITSSMFSYFNGKVTLPSLLEVIGYSAFYGATIDKLDFSVCSNLREIGAGAFSNINLTSASLDFAVNSKLVSFLANPGSGTGTFQGYKGHVILPKNLTTIPYETFTGFSGSLTLSPSLEVIGSYAFYRANIDKLDFSVCPNLREIGAGAFSNINLTSASLDFASNLKLVSFLANGGSATGTFSSYTGYVILPKNLTTIPYETFTGFGGTVKIWEGLKTIQNFAFYSSGIKEIELPASLQSIGERAFAGCNALIKITSHNPLPPLLGTTVFLGVDNKICKLIVPKGSECKYAEANQWKDFISNTCTVDLQLAYAPNSYIFDINEKGTFGKEYGGLYIPVAKAYAMWGNNEYLKTSSIPNGKLSASIYWEDISGLIKSADIEGLGWNAKIKVMVDRSKGKGNAVVAFHVGDKGDHTDPIYWSWHVWVTDNPTQGGVQYGHELEPEKDMNGNVFVPTYMDRNLGATSNVLLGNEWNKTGGLMYQWGRKDPFPPLSYLDYTHYEITGAFNNNAAPLKYSDFKSGARKENRKFDDVSSNIAYSVNNPFIYINKRPEEPVSFAHWFSSSKEIQREGGFPVNYDLWGDATKGRSIAGTSKPNYPEKSPFDPCPSGWRVPSFRNQQTYLSTDSPWGKAQYYENEGGKVTINGEEVKLQAGDIFNKYTGMHYFRDLNGSLYEKYNYNNIKIYPSVGYDFTNVAGRNLGKFSLGGRMWDYVDSNGPIYQDNGSELILWSATLNGSSLGSGFHVTANNLEGSNNFVLNLNSWQMQGTYIGQAVRCMQDPNLHIIGDNSTVYIPAVDIDYTEGLNNPNTYLVKNISQPTQISIPVNKAYAVYNQYLTDHKMPQGKLSANVHWTTNANLIKTVKMNGTNQDSSIILDVNPGQTGNAVISLHSGSNGNSDDEILWSWQIWAPNGDPEAITYTHVTEDIMTGLWKSIINPTKSGLPPLTTTFMDRNLGAIETFPIITDHVDTPLQAQVDQAKKSGGMHYQWGRKDPIPTFQADQPVIYIGSNKSGTGIPSYTAINSSTYNTNYTALYSNYSQTANVTTTDKKHQIISKILKYSANNPLNYMYNTGKSSKGENSLDWISNENGWAFDRWGHADKKSPFDPCPEGWRVPDQSFVSMADRLVIEYINKGTSPWYSGRIQPTGTSQTNKAPINSNYKGKRLKGLGLSFTDPLYNIGGYPFNGVRGYEYGAVNIDYEGKIFNAWSSVLVTSTNGKEANVFGRPPALEGDNDYNMNSVLAAAMISDKKPQSAASVRCAKDLPRYIGEPINTYLTSSFRMIDKTISQVEKVTNAKTEIQITPNPTYGIFKVLTKGEGSIQVFDMSGRIVYSNTLKGQEFSVNISDKPAGVYIVKVEVAEQIVTQKIIKK